VERGKKKNILDSLTSYASASVVLMNVFMFLCTRVYLMCMCYITYSMCVHMYVCHVYVCMCAHTLYTCNTLPGIRVVLVLVVHHTQTSSSTNYALMPFSSV
jgi:hypothetical protein